MEKKNLKIPFCCVNSEVLWKGEEALINALSIDKKIAQLNLDAIFTARLSDVPLIKAATNRIQVGITYHDSMKDKLKEIKKTGVDVLIFDDIDQVFKFTALERVINTANKLEFLILARVDNPLEIPKSLLKKIQIIKWKDNQSHEENSSLRKNEKSDILKIKNENPNLSIIYGAKKISTDLILNSLLKGMDGIGEYSQCKNTYENLDEMFYAIHDYKNVQEFINT